ncbi:MAG: hypothetical protein F3743_08880 [Nitrospinae bacterium]|nr:hypothetical protein [Nitrospinota bacterium]MZH05501.1 hypothetical protein [Nitrospinota bacterium]MZH14023.1 hypothetical protein [Nitrospinota bacterium]
MLIAILASSSKSWVCLLANRLELERLAERMDFLVIEQVWAIVLFLLGAFVLNTCSKWERKEYEFFKDPKNRYGRRKSDVIKPKTLRGTLMTIAGTGLSLGGMILFMMHI